MGVCDSPTEARKSEVVGFELSKNSLPINLTAAQNSYRLSDRIEFKVEPRSDFDLVHNSRVIGKIINGTGVVSASKFGLGKVQLQAVIGLDDGTLERSAPFEIEIVSN